MPEWNDVGIHVAELSGFTRVGTVAYDRQKYVVLEQPGVLPPAVLP